MDSEPVVLPCRSERGGRLLTLDVWLVARLALEIREGLAGARIQSVAGDSAGLRVWCYRRGGTVSLHATFDSDGPLVALHETTPANENVAGGWAGGVAPLLRGCTVESVQAVPDDRIIFCDLVSRSAFGVPARHRLAFELEPNKANILVLRPGDADLWRILAAAKEIEGQGDARDILVGEVYDLPPVRRPKSDVAAFRGAIDAVDVSADIDARGIARLLGELDPTCSPPLARETLERALAKSHTLPFSMRLLDAWSDVQAEVEAASTDAGRPVYAWRRAADIAVCHLIPLTWPPGEPERMPALNDACAAQQSAGERRRRAPAANALRKRLTTMLDRCSAELASLQAAQRRAADANGLRAAGEAIYTYLAEIPERAEEFVTPEGLHVSLDPASTAKANAAAYFKRFKKARSGLPQIAKRIAVLEANRVFWEDLVWQLERAQSATPEELSTVCDEIADAIGFRKSAAKRKPGKKQSTRSVELPGGAIAHVGKSPKDNERVTFSVAGPNDLWFHARGVPGAHVVLKLADAGGRASDEQILAAAALAAGQSRAADAGKVDVDYTMRKHVRKQGGGRVGLVWYTDYKTVLVAPREI